MTLHFQHHLDKINRMILSLGGLVEQSVEGAIRSISARDVALADRVIQSDLEIDLMEVEVEEECLHALALYQPVAFDLRYIVAVLKINNDLERIGDLAVNLAQQSARRIGRPWTISLPPDIFRMASLVQVMLKHALDSLVKIDADAAESVLKTDDEVDSIHRGMYDHVEAGILANSQLAEQYISLLVISRQFERIADHATNIAEDVLYMARGDIQRHGQRLRSGSAGGDKPQPGEPRG
jgi:phosphate transport system protein